MICQDRLGTNVCGKLRQGLFFLLCHLGGRWHEDSRQLRHRRLCCDAQAEIEQLDVRADGDCSPVVTTTARCFRNICTHSKPTSGQLFWSIRASTGGNII